MVLIFNLATVLARTTTSTFDQRLERSFHKSSSVLHVRHQQSARLTFLDGNSRERPTTLNTADNQTLEQSPASADGYKTTLCSISFVVLLSKTFLHLILGFSHLGGGLFLGSVSYLLCAASDGAACETIFPAWHHGATGGRSQQRNGLGKVILLVCTSAIALRLMTNISEQGNGASNLARGFPLGLEGWRLYITLLRHQLTTILIHCLRSRSEAFSQYVACCSHLSLQAS